MLKVTVLVLVVLVADSIGQRFIHPTYRPSTGPVIILPTYRPPPQRGPIIRTVRNAPPQEPLWLYQGDIPRAPSSADNGALPSIIDDVRFNPDRRYARSVGSSSSGEADDHRTKRDVTVWPTLPPTFPKPSLPGPYFPRPGPGPFNPFPRPGPPITPRPIYANH